MKPLILLLVLLVAPLLVSAQGFEPLTGVPALDPLTEGPGDMAAFFNQLYVLAVGAAAIIAVVQIMIAGFKLAYSGGNFGAIEEARNNIQNAILGLLLVLSPTIVFGIINPDILNLSIDTRIFERKEVTEEGIYTEDPLIAEAGSKLVRNKYGEYENVCGLQFNGDATDRFVGLTSLGKGDDAVGRACCRLMDGEVDNEVGTCDLSSLIDNDRYVLGAAIEVILDDGEGQVRNGTDQDARVSGSIRSAGANFTVTSTVWGIPSLLSRDNPMLAIHGFRTKGQCEAVGKSATAVERLIRNPSTDAGLLRFALLFGGGDSPEIVEKIIQVSSVSGYVCQLASFDEI